jgi:hypothetical protein
VLPRLVTLIIRPADLGDVWQVVRRDTQETKEAIRTSTPKEPWVLPKSIFKERLRNTDSKDFYDSEKIQQEAFAIEWSKLTKKVMTRQLQGITSNGNVMAM